MVQSFQLVINHLNSLLDIDDPPMIEEVDILDSNSLCLEDDAINCDDIKVEDSCDYEMEPLSSKDIHSELTTSIDLKEESTEHKEEIKSEIISNENSDNDDNDMDYNPGFSDEEMLKETESDDDSSKDYLPKPSKVSAVSESDEDSDYEALTDLVLTCGIMGCKSKQKGGASLSNHRKRVHYVGDHFDPKLDEHLMEHFTKNPAGSKDRYSCKLCEHTARLIRPMEHHVALEHFNDMKPVICPFCQSKFQHTDFLKKHLKVGIFLKINTLHQKDLISDKASI